MALPHLTSPEAESILAQACENESNNAKRMRIGLEALSVWNLQNIVAWILLCKHCKFGEKITTIPEVWKFTLGDYFIGVPCRWSIKNPRCISETMQDSHDSVAKLSLRSVESPQSRDLKWPSVAFRSYFTYWNLSVANVASYRAPVTYIIHVIHGECRTGELRTRQCRTKYQAGICNAVIYMVAPKLSRKLLSMSLPNINRFSDFFSPANSVENF